MLAPLWSCVSCWSSLSGEAFSPNLPPRTEGGCGGKVGDLPPAGSSALATEAAGEQNQPTPSCPSRPRCQPQRSRPARVNLKEAEMPTSKKLSTFGKSMKLLEIMGASTLSPNLDLIVISIQNECECLNVIRNRISI